MSEDCYHSVAGDEIANGNRMGTIGDISVSPSLQTISVVFDKPSTLYTLSFTVNEDTPFGVTTVESNGDSNKMVC